MKSTTPLAWATLRLAWATLRLAWATLRLAWATPRLAWATPRLAWATPRLAWATPRLAWATLATLVLGCAGCSGSREAEAWAEEEPQETAPLEWEGAEGQDQDRSRARRVSSSQGYGSSKGPGGPGFAQPGRRRIAVAQGQGWRVSTTGGQPVETFESADGPVGFGPRDPRAPTPPLAAAADRPGPWLTVPSQAPETSVEDLRQPTRTPLRMRAEGVELVPGECGLVPVARYGLDWRPAREWRIGQDAEAEPWLRPIPTLPLPPLPKPGEIKEAEVPAGSWIEAR